MNSTHPSVSERSALKHSIDHVRHLLPTQGPIEIFIHHNTLHAFEKLDFEQAVERAAEIYDANPYLAESKYRDLYLDGIIKLKDVELQLGSLIDATSDSGILGLSRKEFRTALMLHGLSDTSPALTQWRFAERRLRWRGDLPLRFRRNLTQTARDWLIEVGDLSASRASSKLDSSDLFDRLGFDVAGLQREELTEFLHATNLNKSAVKRAESLAASIQWLLTKKFATELPIDPPPSVSHTGHALKILTDEDIFELVEPILVQLCSSFIDQGVSHWPMPHRELGFAGAVRDVLNHSNIISAPWIGEAIRLFGQFVGVNFNSEASLALLLSEYGVTSDQLDNFLEYGTLKLKGWAGYFSYLEANPHVSKDRPTHARFDEFLLVQNILLLAATKYVCKKHNLHSYKLSALQTLATAQDGVRYQRDRREQRAQQLFELTQILGIGARDLFEGGTILAQKLIEELESFPSEIRRRVWHLAYEDNHLRSAVEALGNHLPTSGGANGVKAQLIFCIDEREESLRRHLEELDSSIDTFGYPGFFNLAIEFKGIHHLHPEALCPVVMQPNISVVEHGPNETISPDNAARQRFVGFSQQLQSWTRRPIVGSIVSTLMGHLSLIPFAMRILRPSLAGHMHETLHAPRVALPKFKVGMAQSDNSNSDEEVLDLIAKNVAGVFKATGIVNNFSRLIVLVGHGSSSLNNPHESAHDCGACGGRRGSASARMFARFANDLDVRHKMRDHGVVLPSECFVLGAYHDTCDDSITIFDNANIPAEHKTLVDEVTARLVDGCARNSQERSRRFLTSRRDLSPERAAAELIHRAEDFSEPRPEYGHATNSVAFIGRRSQTRNLFMDRRAFLTSYDSNSDPDGSILQGLLGAVVPVCSGINLEYYFSRVDPIVYGCGTKLPHNIVGQIGVMDGSSSDLRTGLPWQMVEIHEPVRLVMIVEASPEKLQNVLNKLPKVESLIRHRWLWMLAFNSDSRQFFLYSNGMFVPYEYERRELPKISDSISYCKQSSRALPFASIAKKGGRNDNRTLNGVVRGAV